MAEDKPELLGDKVEKVLHAARIDKIAELYEKIANRPCGCAKRKTMLNKMHQDYLDRKKKRENNNGIK